MASMCGYVSGGVVVGIVPGCTLNRSDRGELRAWRPTHEHSVERWYFVPMPAIRLPVLAQSAAVRLRSRSAFPSCFAVLPISDEL